MPKPEIPGERTDLLHLDQPVSGNGGGGCGGGGGGGGACCGGRGRGHGYGNPDCATNEGTEATPSATDA